MPTNDRKTNIYHKRLMSLTAIKDQFLDYLQGCIDEVGSAFFAFSVVNCTTVSAEYSLLVSTARTRSVCEPAV